MRVCWTCDFRGVRAVRRNGAGPAKTEPAPIDPNGEAASPALAKHRIGREVYTLPPPGERLKLMGPWPGGRKTMRRNNDEAAQTFWERCETAIADREVCSLRTPTPAPLA